MLLTATWTLPTPCSLLVGEDPAQGDTQTLNPWSMGCDWAGAIGEVLADHHWAASSLLGGCRRDCSVVALQGPYSAQASVLAHLVGYCIPCACGPCLWVHPLLPAGPGGYGVLLRSCALLEATVQPWVSSLA